jgi:hypothetical protein
VILAPYPNNPNPVESFNIKTDFDIQGNGLVWYARPQLFCNCTLCPIGAKGRSGSHKEVSLVYFSTFEPIKLTPDSVMQRAGMPMLYDSASNLRLPCLYICPVTNVLGRAPLIRCFVGGNSHVRRGLFSRPSSCLTTDRLHSESSGLCHRSVGHPGEKCSFSIGQASSVIFSNSIRHGPGTGKLGNTRSVDVNWIWRLWQSTAPCRHVTHIENLGEGLKDLALHFFTS